MQIIAETHHRQSARVDMPASDVRIEGHGGVFLFRWLTDAGRDWIANNIGGEARFFGAALVVDQHSMQAVADGMAAAGLAVE